MKITIEYKESPDRNLLELKDMIMSDERIPKADKIIIKKYCDSLYDLTEVYEFTIVFKKDNLYEAFHAKTESHLTNREIVDSIVRQFEWKISPGSPVVAKILNRESY